MCFANALFPLPKQCPIPVVSRGSVVLYITSFEVAMALLIVRKIFYVIKKRRKILSHTRSTPLGFHWRQEREHGEEALKGLRPDPEKTRIRPHLHPVFDGRKKLSTNSSASCKN